MALDPNIILSQRPQPSAIEQLAQVMGIKHAIQQQQASALELQQHQQAMQAQQYIDEVARQTLNPDGSINVPAIKSAAIRGGFYHAVPALEKSLYDAEDARTKLYKTQAETGKTQAETDKIKLESDDLRREGLGALAAGVKAANYRPEAFMAAIATAAGSGFMPKDEAARALLMVPEQPDQIPVWTDRAIAVAPKTSAKLQETATSAAQQRLAEAELPAKQADAAIKQQVAAGTVGGLTPEQQRQAETARVTAERQAESAKSLEAYRAARLRQGPAGAAAADRDTANVKEAVSGMKEGSIPPIMPSRASREYVEIMAESRRQGFDLSKANQDWTATQKYLSTLNGPSQVRLRQAINFTKESIPVVRDLVQQWDAGHFPLLNAANLKLAQNGVFGDKAASIASRLQGQIADLTSELGTVYKGGNSSTDESLKLAAENLKKDWSKQVALDALDQIDTNITIRQHSMKHAGIVANEGNPYEPKSSPESLRKPIPGIPGGEAESTDGGKTWKRVK